MKNPLVSILIASYNKEKYVNRCIKSCLSQTYKNIGQTSTGEGEFDNVTPDDIRNMTPDEFARYKASK